MSSLVHFLTDLARNPRMQEIFERDPEVMMEAAELSETDKRRLNSGDRAKVAAALLDELETHELVAVMGACLGSDPGPDPEPDPDPLPGDED